MELPRFHEMHPLGPLCTLSIGGPARYLVEIRSVPEMQAVIKHCTKMQLPYFILGKGSNCLFSDQGFNGVVIVNKINFLQNPAPSLFHVGSGYSFSRLGVQTARLGWGGLEFASGIPATVGGAIFMNAGANGCETCDTVLTVDYIDENGELHTLKQEEMQFSYRNSIFQRLPGAIVTATFQLKPTQLARQRQLDIIAYRKATQPYNQKSAGCIFRNPHEGHAGKLIEECGLKGTHIGDAEVSMLHANFLINKGSATAQELLTLIEHVKQKVKQISGIELQSEICLIPYQLPTSQAANEFV